MIIDALKGTPWWVYVLFAYLIFVGAKALKTRTVSLKKTFILPAILLGWSFYTLSSKLNTWLDFGIWALSLVCGVAIGWGLTHMLKIKADKHKVLIRIPGGALTLILLLLIFALKYFFGYSYATDPNARHNLALVMSDLISSGVITGMFFGKAFCLCYTWKKSEHTDLKESS